MRMGNKFDSREVVSSLIKEGRRQYRQFSYIILIIEFVCLVYHQPNMLIIVITQMLIMSRQVNIYVTDDWYVH